MFVRILFTIAVVAVAGLILAVQAQPTRRQEDRQQPQEDEVFPVSATLRPKILYTERATYTELARKNKVEGAVVLTVTYSKDATIKDIAVVRGLPDGLTESAIAAARKIKFEPAKKKGKPVSVRGNVEMNFRL